MFLMNAENLTYGTRGIPSIPSPSFFGFMINTKIRYYFMFLIVLLAVIIFVRRMLNSGFGIAILTINDDPIAASAIGIFPTKYKLVSFVIGAVIAGVMGSLFAVYTRFIGPTNFAYSESISMVAMVVLGGLGSIPGSILGATLLTVLPEALRSLSRYRMIIYGLAMVAVMIFRPHGIWGMDKRKKNAYLQNL
jgi:branched-chain amino acid transport system permease protein